MTDETPTWIQNAGTFGAGSGAWPTGPGMSHRDIERRVADTLRGATDSIAAHSNVLHTLAAHEGGHAIVARALGLPIREVSIDVDHGGVNRYDADRAPEGWSSTDDATILLAGVVAERMSHPATALEGSEDDEAALLALMSQEQAPDVRRAMATVTAILRDNRGAFDTLVDALIRRRHLTGAEVDEVLTVPKARPDEGVDGAGNPFVRRHKYWVEYDPEQPPAVLGSREAVEAYNAMHRAGEAGDWSLHRQMQGRLLRLTERR